MQKVFQDFLNARTKTKQEATRRGLTFLEFLHKHPEHPLAIEYRQLQLIINSTSGIPKKKT